MAMGAAGMVMGSMDVPLPGNTLPMMTGYGQFGPVAYAIQADAAGEPLQQPGPNTSPTMDMPGGMNMAGRKPGGDH